MFFLPAYFRLFTFGRGQAASATDQNGFTAVGVGRPASNRGCAGAIHAAASGIAGGIAALSMILGLYSVSASEPVIPLDALVFAAAIFSLVQVGRFLHETLNTSRSQRCAAPSCPWKTVRVLGIPAGSKIKGGSNE